jgi:hypothetical protein
MYARSVTLGLDPRRWDEVLEFSEAIKERIGGFPGLLSWMLVGDPTSGRAVSFSLFEDRAAFSAVNDDINAIVADFRRFFVASPGEVLGEVVAHLDSRS